MLAVLMGYASILSLYPRLVNPASLLSYYLDGSDVDALTVALDAIQVGEDAKVTFQRRVGQEAGSGQLQPA
jgi:hypothetical protein